MKTRLHTFSLTIVTDIPCAKAVALREARRLLRGVHFNGFRDGEPKSFRVRSIKPTKEAKS